MLIIALIFAFLCFALAAGLEPDGASVDSNKIEQVR